MISITTLTFDPAGAVLLNPMRDTGRIIYERRVSKAATLDGLSTISDFGYTASDNTLTIKVKDIRQDQLDTLIYLVKTYPLLRYSCADGVFLGSLNNIRAWLNPVEFTFDIKEQIA